MITLRTPLSRIVGIGPRFLTKFKKLHIETIGDLLYHFPSRYEDFSEIYQIADLEPGQQATIQGEVEDIDSHRTWRRQMTVVTATIRDASGTIKATWFNQPYIKNALKPGMLANFSGKVSVSESDHEIYLSHPTYERVGEEINHPTRHTGRLVAVYPETHGLTSKGIRFVLQPILEHLGEVEEWIPDSILEEQDFPSIKDALHNIHTPTKLEDALRAQERFAFEDLFLLQFANVIEKMRLAGQKAPQCKADIEEVKGIIAHLPFELTFSQKKSLWEIMKDIEKPYPMNRLLQGDVGSGKTVVAAIAALIAARNKFQTAFMAPTEILARQHYETLKKLFSQNPDFTIPPVALIAAGTAKVFYEAGLETDMKKDAIKVAIKKGDIPIVVGTHALIAEPKGNKKTAGTLFKNLGLVIIDEQHRFGVDQRAKLLKTTGGKDDRIPHFLSMSATPIPRTLMLSLFGDLDISTITELPQGRKAITTKIVGPSERDATHKFIRSEVKSGRQAFVICPRINPTEHKEELTEEELRGIDMKSVTEEYEKLAKHIFPDLRVAMLHGQMKPKEKTEIMRAFRAHETDILVATSVIEVGVDVPNVTVMIIEGSDRFGLAQLYQFRGRIGRGEHASYCFLFVDSDAKTAHKRLKAILEAKNGFELAERDLELRGPGEFIGQKQTGLPDYAMRGLQNIELIKESREAALSILRADPRLQEHPELRTKVNELRAKIHME